MHRLAECWISLCVVVVFVHHFYSWKFVLNWKQVDIIALNVVILDADGCLTLNFQTHKFCNFEERLLRPLSFEVALIFLDFFFVVSTFLEELVLEVVPSGLTTLLPSVFL